MTNTCNNNTFPGGVMSVARATAGTATIATITNTDNSDSGSKAILKIETGGASGGDPFLVFYNSVKYFSVGIDNSSDDGLVFAESSSLGTSNACKCVDGCWTYENNSLFSANTNTAVNNITGNGTAYKRNLDVIRANIGSDYDTANDYYVCPETGVYLFTGAWHCYAGGNCVWNISQITVNATVVIEQIIAYNSSNIDNYGAVSFIIDLDASDIVIFELRANGMGSDGCDLVAEDIANWWMGALIS